MARLDISHTSSYWRFVAIMALSCIISETKRDRGQSSRFFHTSAFDAPVRWESRRNIATIFVTEKLKSCDYPKLETEDMVIRFDTIHEPGRQQDVRCDVYVGGQVRVSEFMIFLDLPHRGSK